MILAADPVGLWQVGAQLAECPTWIPGQGMLGWVDIPGLTYNVLNPVSGEVKRRGMPGKIGSAAPRCGDSAIVALETGLWESSPNGDLAALASPDMSGIHFNDGKCDPAGRFWVGSRASDGSTGGGALFRYDPDGTVRQMAEGFDVPNGLGWSADGTAFFLIDTVPRVLYRYDFNMALGTIANRRIVCRFHDLPGKPDGLAVDGQDRIWCAMWDGRGIAVLSFAGELLGWLPTPCQRPTSCAFGGEGGRTLFVTTASYQLDPHGSDFGEAGSILAFRANAQGVPVALFGASPEPWA